MNGGTWVPVLLAAALLAAPRVRRRPVPIRRGLGVGTRFSVPSAIGSVLLATVMLGPAVALAVGLVTTTVVTRRRRRLRRRDSRGEGRALAAALEILVGELRVGAHPVSGFAAAAEAVGTAASERKVGAVMGAVAARARLGADVAGGIRESARRSSAPQYWSRVAVCWQLAADHGLPMATLMQTAHKDITDRQRFADRVEAGLSGARATALVLAGLPILGVLLGQLVGAEPLSFLFGGGAVVLATGVSLLCVGVAWSDRIIDRVGA